MTTPAPIVTWTANGVTSATQFQPGGALVEGFRVGFTTGNGLQGTVFVPGTLINNTAAVTQLIHDQAAALEGILALKAPGQ